MEIEYWIHIRQTASGSYFVTIPAGEANKLIKSQNSPILGEEVKVRVVM